MLLATCHRTYTGALCSYRCLQVTLVFLTEQRRYRSRHSIPMFFGTLCISKNSRNYTVQEIFFTGPTLRDWYHAF